MDKPLRYLKINKQTYRLLHEQMYDFDTCQFCGSEDGQTYRKSTDKRGVWRHTGWIRRCKSCSKTTAQIAYPQQPIESMPEKT